MAYVEQTTLNTRLCRIMKRLYGEYFNEFDGTLQPEAKAFFTDKTTSAAVIEALIETGLVEKTYAELVELIANSNLIKGQLYLITNYQTTYNMPNVTPVELITCNTEPLVVEAITSNTLSPVAFSALYPQDILYYKIENDQAKIPGCTKGCIYRRIDTLKNNDIGFDYRNVKFRRWQIEVTEEDSTGTGNDYVTGQVVKKTGTNEIYVKLDDTPNTIFNNLTSWKRFEWDNLDYVSPTPTQWNLFDIPYLGYVTCGSNYKDYTLFSTAPTAEGTQSSYAEIHNNVIDSSNDILGDCNSIFFGNVINNNKIGRKFKNNTSKNNFVYNIIAANFHDNSSGIDFQYNSIAENFGNNSTTLPFQYNNIQRAFNNNLVGSSFIGNNVGADFYFNFIGAYFMHNKIDREFQYNFVGRSFTSNVISYGFRFNLVGELFSFNQIDANFMLNSILNNFISNIILSNFANNVIASFFTKNKVGIGFNGNTVGEDFTLNNIGDGCINNLVADGCYYFNLGDNVVYSTFGSNCNKISIRSEATSCVIGENCGPVEIGSGCFQLVLGTGCLDMKFGNHCYQITVGNSSMFTTFGDSVDSGNFTGKDLVSNTFKSNISLAGLNFSSATHLLGAYNCEVFKNSANIVRLSYYDANDVLNIVPVTA